MPKEVEPFPVSLTIDGNTYWFWKTFRTREKLSQEAHRLQRFGYKTYVIDRVHIDGLYTYPGIGRYTN